MAKNELPEDLKDDERVAKVLPAFYRTLRKKELGEEEILLHEKTGAFAAACVDHLITIGPLSRAMYEAARKAAPSLSVSWYESVEAFLEHAGEEIRAGDTVLVKASHFM